MRGSHTADVVFCGLAAEEHDEVDTAHDRNGNVAVMRRRGRSLAMIGMLTFIGVVCPAGGSMASSGPPSTTEAGVLDLAGAKAGLATFLLANPVDVEVAAAPGVTPVCPLLEPVELATAMREQGLQPNTDQFLVGVHDSEIVEGMRYVNCGVDVLDAFEALPAANPPHFADLSASDMTGRSTWDEVVAGYVDSGGVVGKAPGIGGQTVTTCTPSEDVAWCVVRWHDAGLQIELVVLGPEGDIPDALATDLLVSIVPVVVGNLATAS